MLNATREWLRQADYDREEIAWDYFIRGREVIEWFKQQIESSRLSEDTASS